MPAYRFEALDPQGRTHQDLIEADSERAARQQLRARQWVPLSVVAVWSRSYEVGATPAVRAAGVPTPRHKGVGGQ